MKTDLVWENFLDAEEALVWEGRPSSDRPKKIPFFKLLLGVPSCLIGVMWILATLDEGSWKWSFGLIFLIGGLFQITEYSHVRPYLRSKTWYALSNKRALIAHKVPLIGCKLRSFPITSDMPLGMETRYNSGVYFAERRPLYSNGQGKISYGFELIEDTEHVHRLMSEMRDSI